MKHKLKIGIGLCISLFFLWAFSTILQLYASPGIYASPEIKEDVQLSIEQPEIALEDWVTVKIQTGTMSDESLRVPLPKGVTLDEQETAAAENLYGTVTYDVQANEVVVTWKPESTEVKEATLKLRGTPGSYELEAYAVRSEMKVESEKVALEVEDPTEELISGVPSTQEDISGEEVVFPTEEEVSAASEEAIQVEEEPTAVLDAVGTPDAGLAGLQLNFGTPSKTTLNGYTDYADLQIIPKTNDIANPLYNGKLVLKIGTGLKLTNYPVVGESIKNYQYNYIDNTLTYWFNDSLNTTGLPIINVHVLPSPIAGKVGVDYAIEGALTGTTKVGAVYDTKVAKTPIFTTSNVEYIAPSEKSLKFNPENIKVSGMPGQHLEFYTRCKNFPAKNLNFSNFTIKTEAVSKNVFGYFMSRAAPITFTGDADKYNDKNRLVATKLYNEAGVDITNGTDEEKRNAVMQVSETGQYSYLNNNWGGYFGYTIPANAVPGTVYEYKYSYYDGLNFIASVPIKITVSPITTVASHVHKIPSEIPIGNGYVDQSITAEIETAGKGISNFETIYQVPEGLVPESYSFRNGGKDFGTVYYQYDTDAPTTWNLVKASTFGGYTFKDIPNREKIRKIKLVFPNAITNYLNAYSPNIMRYSYLKAQAGEKFIIKNEKVSYKDENTNEVKEIPPSPDLITIAKDFSAIDATFGSSWSTVKDSTGFERVYKNGERFAQKFSIGGESYSPVKQPYKFIVVPKGVSLDTITDRFGVPITNNYTYQMINTTWRITPQTGGDITKKKTLKDGSTLYFFEDTSYLSRISNDFFYQWKSDYRFNIVNALSGTYSVLYGTGSATSDKISNRDKTTLTDPNKGVSKEIQDALKAWGVTSTTYVPGKTQQLQVLAEDNLVINSKVKLTTQDQYVDVTDPAALMETVPGQAVDYQVEVKNTGTTEMKDVSILDILPYQGDKQILRNDPRNSNFRLFLTSPITDIKKNAKILDPATYTLQYSKSNTPQRWDADGNVINGDAWGEVSEKITDVQAFKLHLKDSLVPGDSVLLSFKFQVPADAPRPTNGKMFEAHNTIAYHSTQKTAESNQVRIQTKIPGKLELSGHVFDDANLNGMMDTGETGFDSQTVRLYKKTGTTLQKVDERQTTESEAKSGFYIFTELENNQTYKVGIDVTKLEEKGYTPSQLESINSSIKIGVDPEDKTKKIGWLMLNGREEFIVGDSQLEGYAPKYTLYAPFFKASTLTGTVQYAYFDGGLSNKKDHPSTGMTVTLQNKDGSPVKTNDGKPVQASVGDFGHFGFEKVPFAKGKEYQLGFSDSREKGLTYRNKKIGSANNQAVVTIDGSPQPTAVFKSTVAGTGSTQTETATFTLPVVKPEAKMEVQTYVTSFNQLKFGMVSEDIQFGENGKVPIPMRDKVLSIDKQNTFKLQVEDTRVIKEPSWHVEAKISNDLQAVENKKVVASLPGALGFIKKEGENPTSFVPDVGMVIYEAAGIQEKDPDNMINIPTAGNWSNKRGLVLTVPGGTPQLKTYSTDIMWTLVNGPSNPNN